MSSTEPQIAANRANALKSTGPISITGKARSSRNSLRHGLLSASLVLADEDPAEFQTMLADLERSLRPAGLVEEALVERVAITLWRQRRLVTAETASLAIERRDEAIAHALGQMHDRKLGHDIGADDLQPFDPLQLTWCENAVSEIEALTEIAFETLPTAAPLVWAQLVSDVEEGQSGPQEHVRAYKNGLTGYVGELLVWCRAELSKAEQRPRLLALAGQMRARNLVLPQEQLELFARYQTTLDNQLAKALRALREAQEWRLKTIDGQLHGDEGTSTDVAA